MKRAKIFRRIDIKSTLDAMDVGSFIELPFRLCPPTSLRAAATRNKSGKEYSISCNSIESITKVIRVK